VDLDKVQTAGGSDSVLESKLPSLLCFTPGFITTNHPAATFSRTNVNALSKEMQEENRVFYFPFVIFHFSFLILRI
jgi:hypothetical protein